MIRSHVLAATLLAASLFAAPALQAAEIRVVSSGGFAAAYKILAPEFERQTGNTLRAEWGPSMGETPGAVPQRLARGEKIDVVIMVGYALDKLADAGKVAPGDKAALARSGVSVAVKEGAPVPKVATVDELRQALLAAHSIAYSDSASGVYIQNEMFKKMGIEDQVRGKAHMIPADPVGEIVAKGQADIGFQQTSELLPIKGITIAGPLPAPLQLYTVFSAGVLASSEHKDEARALIRFLSSPAAAKAIQQSGMEPLGAAQ